MNEIDSLKSALARERAARAAAEELLERKSTELFRVNQDLRDAKNALEHRVEEADAQVRVSLSRLRLAMSAASAGAFVWRCDEDVVQMDMAVCAMIGVPHDHPALTLSDWVLLLHASGRKPVLDALSSVPEDGHVECELHPAANDRVLRLTGRVTAEETGSDVLFALVTDVTRQRRQQLTRRRLATVRERRERLAIMGELTSSIAHEINQPLGSICNYAAAARRMLASVDASTDLSRALEQIETLSMRVSATIKQLRAMLSEGDAALEQTSTRAIVDRAVESTESAARDAGVHIATEVLDCQLTGAPLLLERAISNLIRNAVEAMEDARMRGVVTVRARSEAGHTVFQVDDEGPGLGGLDPEEVFEPLVTSRPAGSGMGLSLCRTVAEQHGGDVRCMHSPNHPTGLRLELRIPQEGRCSQPSMS